MDVIYLAVMSAALLAIAASVVAAVRSVARAPAWTLDVVPRTGFDGQDHAIEDRRQQSLPFVGRERRAVAQQVPTMVEQPAQAVPERLAA